MAFELTYEDLSSRAFADALNKLSMSTGFHEAKTAYDVGKLVEEIFTFMAKCQKEFVPIASEYVLKDDTGKPVKKEDDPGSVKIIPERVAEWEKTYKDFTAKTVTVQRHKIPLNSLNTCKLSPQELIALDPILLS